MPQIALKIEYLGTHYHGWQRQGGLPSVQQAVEEALFLFLGEQVRITAAGRTDKGVHAEGQVAHFETKVLREMHEYVFGLNHFLAKDIRVLEAKVVADDFHARFDAIFRRYEMRILNRPMASAIWEGRVLSHPVLLDIALMQEGANYLLGAHDFTSFRGRDCQAKSPFKHLQFCKISREEDLITLNIQAGGFLHNMVRNITGVLIKIGEGRKPPIWAKEVLEARKREAGGKTVSPEGLYLVEIGYPTRPILSAN